MKLAIQKHKWDFIALAALMLIALATTSYILSQERFHLPSWVPVLGSDFYRLNVELETGQAVVPGQGQTINIAGVKVGDVKSVKLENGVAIVSVDVEKKYAPVYRNAKVLLRPKTGLKDMFLELDPGDRDSGALPDGGTIPVANTLPDVNPDEVLSSLDADTRAYLVILLTAGGEAFTDRPGHEGETANDLRQTFKRFDPINRNLAAISSAVAARRRNVRRVIHNFRLISDELASTDGTLGRFVESSNVNFRAFARQDTALREAIALLPGTLEAANTGLQKADQLGQILGPTAKDLQPFAKALGPTLQQVRPFLIQTTPVIKNQLRPFTKIAKPTVDQLRPAAADLKQVTPDLRRTFGVLNSLFNELAFNPSGKEEGYLFWATWANHDAATIFNTNDAHGPIRRGIVILSCGALGVLENIKKTTPQLAVLIELLQAPTRTEACAQPVQSASSATAASAARSKSDKATDLATLRKLRRLG